MPIRHVVSVTSRLSRLSDSGESDIQSTEMYVFLSVSPESDTQGTKTYVWMSVSPESDIRNQNTCLVVLFCRIGQPGVGRGARTVATDAL